MRAVSGAGTPSRLDQNVDLLDHVALDDGVHHVEAVEHVREHRVLVIEPGIIDQVDEELRVARIAPARGQADGPARVRPPAHFVVHEAMSADVLVRAWAAALHDEVGHDPVKREAIVVARLRQLGKPEHRERRLIGQEREVDRAGVPDHDAGAGRDEPPPAVERQYGGAEAVGASASSGARPQTYERRANPVRAENELSSPSVVRRSSAAANAGTACSGLGEPPRPNAAARIA